MDSLLATYASSSDDEQDQHHHHHSNSNSNSNHNHHETSSFSASLEPSSSSSSTNLFNLPQPKSSPSSSLFSSMLPPPKSNQPIRQQPTKNLSSSNQTPKKIVQFRPPLNPSLLKTLNDEDSDDEEEEKSRKPIKVSSTETSSVASFFSSLPAPKSSLGLGSGSSLGAGRKSILDTNALPSSGFNDSRVEKKKTELSNEEEGNLGSGSSSMTTTTSEADLVSGGDGSNWVSSNESYENYGGYVNYENSYGAYEGSYRGSVDMAPQTIMTPEISRAVENVARSQGKRGRNEIPTEIIEVKQDELMKNRPREDQAKMTGIAFGPAYQPASSKGKPSKLHKRKHQIGALYFDMRQKETELADRRSKGFLTKAETQAKYGW